MPTYFTNGKKGEIQRSECIQSHIINMRQIGIKLLGSPNLMPQKPRLGTISGTRRPGASLPGAQAPWLVTSFFSLFNTVTQCRASAPDNSVPSNVTVV